MGSLVRRLQVFASDEAYADILNYINGIIAALDGDVTYPDTAVSNAKAIKHIVQGLRQQKPVTATVHESRYVYHGTKSAYINSIKEHGLRPQKPGGDPNVGPSNVHFFTADGSSDYGGTMLRVPRKHLPPHTKNPRHVWTPHTIRPEHIQIKHNGKWIPLKHHRG
jgi:hypothetical protein